MTLALSAAALASSHLTDDWKVWAFSSSAPSFLADNATITDGKRVLRSGTNGWTCAPGDPRGPYSPQGWASAHEAMAGCFDAAGADWIRGFKTHTKPIMERDALLWMLNGGHGEDVTRLPWLAGSSHGSASNFLEPGPHLMLLPKDPASLAGWPTDFRAGTPWVMFPSTEFAHLVIPLEGYYEYAAHTRDTAEHPMLAAEPRATASSAGSERLIERVGLVLAGVALGLLARSARERVPFMG
eukprot:2665340-Prymnesium_polylepis.1